LYAVLLGNTAQQGMGAIDPALFAQHTDAKLRVWFSDGVNGFQQLSPDRPFASVPYAFNSESAKSADMANTAMAVQAGAITKQMLGNDVLSDLNRTVNHNDLSPQIKADINATIGMNRLSTEVTEKLNQEKTTTNYNAPSVGSLLAVPYGSDAPAGYSLYQRGEPKELVWEEKAPVSVARSARDGVEVLNGKIYFVGGHKGSAKNIAERYDPDTNTWETIASMSVARQGASAVLNGKLYAIAGGGFSSVEVYDPTLESWTVGPSLPHAVNSSAAIVVNEKLYHIGGWYNSQNFKFVHMLDPNSNSWTRLSDMPTARHGLKLVWFENRIWAIGGYNGSYIHTVESFDPLSNSWRTEASMTTKRNRPFAFVANDKIFLGGGYSGSSHLSSIEVYDPTTKQWSNAGNFPEAKADPDAVVLNDMVYVIAGMLDGSSHSNKVYAADLNASVEGVYDLYRKDGDAPVGTPVVESEYADGSVTGSKMADGAITTDKLNEQILKYLKPEITSQPQAQTVYADTNVSFSVSAEGKYLTYQWKKDGMGLTGETNATLNITDANATLHDGNYSVVVSNDFGSVESEKVEVKISDALLNGLVGWWKFDEGSGTVAYDSSGNGNDGNLTNGPTWTDGQIGGALSFDGVDDYVTMGDRTGEARFHNSVSYWFRAYQFNNAEMISKSSPAQGLEILFYNGGLKFFLMTGDVSENKVISFSTGNLNLNQWYHVTAVQFGQGGLPMHFYINGELVGSDVTPETISDADKLYVGRWNADGRLYNGLIDDVRIYDRALSAEEVQALYNLGQ
jgi:N-acetylneuraminic acid mutarotase